MIILKIRAYISPEGKKFQITNFFLYVKLFVLNILSSRGKLETDDKSIIRVNGNWLKYDIAKKKFFLYFVA